MAIEMIEEFSMGTQIKVITVIVVSGQVTAQRVSMK